MRENHDLFVIRGAPGIGKTSLASQLRKSDSIASVIDIDDIRRMMNGEKFICDENETYLNAISVAARLVLVLAANNIVPIVIVDVFFCPFLEAFKKPLMGLKLKVITLTTENEILCNRMLNRKTGFVDIGAAEKINRWFIDSSDSVGRVLNIGNLAEDAVFDLVYSEIFSCNS